jgi:hypothetical protein
MEETRYFLCLHAVRSKQLVDCYSLCRHSPAHSSWYTKNYQEIKMLNPNLPFGLRTTENAMPAVATDLDFTTTDLVKYMLQKNLFVNSNGTIAPDRIEAAKEWLKTDWSLLRRERWASPGFDPCKPFLDDENPDWRQDPKISNDLSLYLAAQDAVDAQEKTMMSGPNKEWERAQNSLLMLQRVDLWCAGEAEVERALQHLLALGKRVNEYEPDFPEYIEDYFPGAPDFQN